jgi:hypothetical protein
MRKDSVAARNALNPKADEPALDWYSLPGNLSLASAAINSFA